MREDLSIPDKDFDAFADWYPAFSEKRELPGSTNHLLYVCRKTQQSKTTKECRY